jgi:prophage antirepressor-like protein
MPTIELIPTQFKEHEMYYIIDTQGVMWWPAHAVCEVLGIVNVSQALARLDADEKRLLRVGEADAPQRKVWFVNQYGLYRLMSSSRKQQAKEFQRWLYHDVLPSIQQTGRYVLTPTRFLANTERPTQVQHSRKVGDLQAAFGGRGNAIRYYIRSAEVVTGKKPNAWCKDAQQQGLHGEARRRGREAMREIEPPKACAISLTDELVLNKVNETEAMEIGKDSVTLFQRIIAAGVTPAELHSAPLDGLEDL